jgi:hypothetical protein
MLAAILAVLVAQLPALLAGLVFAILALLLWWGTLRWFDKLRSRFQTDQNGPLAIIHRDPRATADYYGKRLVAAAILVGFVLSTVRF